MSLRVVDGPVARWRSGQWTGPAVLITVCAAVLVLLGCLMTFSASFVAATNETGDAFAVARRQLLWTALGLPVAVAVAVCDYRRLRPWAVALLVVSLLATALVLVPGLGVKINGARRWFDLGPITMQPVELLKVTLPLGLAAIVSRRWERIRGGDLHGLLMPALPLLALVAVLVLAEPDVETAALLVAIGAMVLWVAGLPPRLLLLGAGTGAVAVALAIARSGFRRGRIIAWLDPASDPGNFGYQTWQGFLALGSGGVFGVGLGDSRGKWLYVPNAYTDFIYAIIGEELGLLGALLVLVLFTGIAVGGVRAALRAPDPFGRLLAAGLVAWLLLQAGINIGSVVGLLPVTGVTLPLVSFGGSSLVTTLVGVGLLVSVARAGRGASGGVEPDPVPASEPALGPSGRSTR